MIKYKYMLIAAASILIVVAFTFYKMGYSKRGEVEATRTTQAIEEAVNAAAIEWEAKMSVAIDSAANQAEIKIETQIVTKEVIRYVQSNTDNRLCFNDDELQFIRQASGVTGTSNP